MKSAFQAAKDALAAATSLAHPDPEAPINLAVDASATAVGAVLQQQSAAGWRPLAFFSRKLDRAQMSYSAFDRELLAAYLAVRHFRFQVEGRVFHILTDHKPLTHALHRVSEPWTARQQRQLSYLAEHTSDIRHLSGLDNVVADALSRPAADEFNAGPDRGAEEYEAGPDSCAGGLIPGPDSGAGSSPAAALAAVAPAIPDFVELAAQQKACPQMLAAAADSSLQLQMLQV